MATLVATAIFRKFRRLSPAILSSVASPIFIPAPASFPAIDWSINLLSSRNVAPARDFFNPLLDTRSWQATPRPLRRQGYGGQACPRTQPRSLLRFRTGNSALTLTLSPKERGIRWARVAPASPPTEA